MPESVFPNFFSSARQNWCNSSSMFSFELPYKHSPFFRQNLHFFFFYMCWSSIFKSLSEGFRMGLCSNTHSSSTLDVCVPSPICALSPFSVVAATMFTGSLIKSMCLTRVWCSSPPADETSSLSKCQSVTGLDTGRQPTPPVADGCILSPKQD